MEIYKSDIICGQPASTVREMLRIFAMSSYSRVSHDRFHHLGLSIVDVHGLMLDLLEEGYLEQCKRDPFFPFQELDDFPSGLTASEKGRRIACARFGKRMSRKSIEKLLNTVIARAEQTSSLPMFRCEVSRLYVFGSYLDETQETYGDLDLVFEHREKDVFLGSEPTNYNTKQLSGMYLSSSESQDIVYEQIAGRINEWHRLKSIGSIDCSPPKPDLYGFSLWDIKAVQYQLKRKNYRISLHSMKEFERLKTSDISLVYDVEQGGRI